MNGVKLKFQNMGNTGYNRNKECSAKRRSVFGFAAAQYPVAPEVHCQRRLLLSAGPGALHAQSQMPIVARGQFRRPLSGAMSGISTGFRNVAKRALPVRHSPPLEHDDAAKQMGISAPTCSAPVCA